jgi:hypothetical protein
MNRVSLRGTGHEKRASDAATRFCERDLKSLAFQAAEIHGGIVISVASQAIKGD